MRKRIFEIIEKAEDKDIASTVYDYLMMIAIIASLVPLAFKDDNQFFFIVDKVTVCIFIIDYFLRWITADFRSQSKHTIHFLRYPFTIAAIIDLISILPSLSIINNGFKALRALRLIRAARTLRVFKAMRYSKNFEIIMRVLHASKDSLLAVCFLAGGYILISALVIFNVEPDSFDTFYSAIYWATVSLTTVGYGDIYPVTVLGRFITMVSSIFGIAIVALPAGIITAGYIDEINKNKNDSTKQ